MSIPGGICIHSRVEFSQQSCEICAVSICICRGWITKSWLLQSCPAIQHQHPHLSGPGSPLYPMPFPGVWLFLIAVHWPRPLAKPHAGDRGKYCTDLVSSTLWEDREVFWGRISQIPEDTYHGQTWGMDCLNFKGRFRMDSLQKWHVDLAWKSLNLSDKSSGES